MRGGSGMKFSTKWLRAIVKPRPRNRARVERKSISMPKIPWKVLLPTLAVCTAVAVIVGAGVFVLDRPVKRITVAGVFRHVSAEDVEKIVRSKLRGGFVRANIATVQRSIEALPWVDHARVQRRWPDGISIEVTEQEAIARWGEFGLINSRGELFIKDEHQVFPDLPRLEGPDGTEHVVADRFFQIQPRLAEVRLQLNGLRLDPRGAWEIELAGGVAVRLGRSQIEQRIDRFIKAGANALQTRPGSIAYVDMRYTNGFSIGGRASPSSTSAPDEASDTIRRNKHV
jgi:cell division protein FtsQ